MTLRSIGVTLSLFVGALVLPWTCLASTMAPALPVVGDSAPTFMYTDFDTGVAMSFETFERNRPVVLVFLQTACRSCHREMAVLKRLQAEFDSFGVLAVFMDMTSRNLKKYIRESELPFACTWDSSSEIGEAYGVTFTPASFLLDGEKRVVKIYKGFHPGVERMLETDLKTLSEH